MNNKIDKIRILFLIIFSMICLIAWNWSFFKKNQIEVSGLKYRPFSITINPNQTTYIFDPNVNYQYFRFTVNESSGCTVTMSEVSAIESKPVYIQNLGPYDLIFQDQAGVSNFRDATLTKGIQDNSMIIYDDSNIWIEWSAGNN